MQAELAPGGWMKAPGYACRVDLAGKLRTLKSFNALYAAGLHE